MGGHDGQGLCECPAAEDIDTVMEMVDPRCPLAGHKGKVTSLAFSPTGGLVVSGSEDRLVKIWDSATGKEVICLAAAR
jgi:WD40 repeat protein